MSFSIKIFILFLAVSLRAASPTDLFTWPGGVATNGPYTLVSVVTNYTVIQPNGNEPSSNSLASHRYRHHTRIAYRDGVIYLAYSSAGVGEGDEGMQTAMSISSDGGATWGNPILLCPSQSDWTTNSKIAGSRISYPRNFSYVQGTNYLTMGVDTLTDTLPHYLSGALFSRAVFPNGTIGPLFRISTNTWTPTNSIADVALDSNMRPLLMPESKLFGVWGGGNDGVQQEWRNYFFDGVTSYQEPGTVSVDGTTNNYFRTYRGYAVGSSVDFVNQCYSTNGGVTFSLSVPTTVPDCPSETCPLRLDTGQFILIGNAKDYDSNYRDPLYLALTAPNSTTITNVSAIIQGLSKDPVYAGYGKLGGAAYPSVVQNGEWLYVGYSIHKENIGFSKVRIPGYVAPATPLSANVASFNKR